jgi:hypothetical protein
MTIPLAINVANATESFIKFTIIINNQGRNRFLGGEALPDRHFGAGFIVRSQEFFSCKHSGQEDMVEAGRRS